LKNLVILGSNGLNKEIIMLNKIVYGIAIMITTLTSTEANTLQDSVKAVEFFTHELDFKTNPHGVQSVIDGKTKNVTIVDVRSEKDFKEGHIPGAINIPFEKHNGFKGSETKFSGLRKDGFNYIYCYEHLCNLAQLAAKKFASLGYPVKEIVGGFNAWKDGKHPVAK
jgi:rhodanese-related sulfurtransferase